tara:strand:- start:10064 stop:10393 length:330 start_codon:yes stop_codon:yes gene_type:complete
VEAIPLGWYLKHGGQLGHLFLSFCLHSTKTFDIIFPVMKDTTRRHLADEIVNLAGVRGQLQSLTSSTWQEADYLRNKIDEMTERLTDIQNKLHEATWSEETDWLGSDDD